MSPHLQSLENGHQISVVSEMEGTGVQRPGSTAHGDLHRTLLRYVLSLHRGQVVGRGGPSCHVLRRRGVVRGGEGLLEEERAC